MGDRELPRAENRLAPDRSVGGYPGKARTPAKKRRSLKAVRFAPAAFFLKKKLAVSYDLLRSHHRRCPLAGTGFIDHIGIGVPDLVAAKQYYDGLMHVLGLREWFETGPGGPLNYGPDGAQGSQLFFYQAGSGNLLAPPNGPSSPRIPGREQSGRPRSTRVGVCPRGDHPGRARRVPSVRGALLCDLLARSSRIQARGGLPQSRRGLAAWRAAAARCHGSQCSPLRYHCAA